MTSQQPQQDSPSPTGRAVRIGTAERDRAAAQLTSHWSAGRLEPQEFDERLALAYQARTAEQLQALFEDLPQGLQPAAAPGGGRLARVPARLRRVTSRVPAGRRGRLAGAALLGVVALAGANEALASDEPERSCVTVSDHRAAEPVCTVAGDDD